MTLLAVLVLLSQAASSEENFQALRNSIEKTADEGYAFAVKGKYDRSGELTPAGLLTSRIRQYQSARLGETTLVKGPEGLWRTPQEWMGEKVEKPDPEAADIVRTLQDAAPPHSMALDLLDLAEKAFGPEDREVDRVLCRRYQLTLALSTLKDSIGKQLAREVKAGTRAQPDEVRWSGARGSVRVYVDKRNGRLVKVVDERSVKIAYKVPDRQPEVKTYRIEMEFEFTPLDPTRLSIPPEVKERLGIRED